MGKIAVSILWNLFKNGNERCPSIGTLQRVSETILTLPVYRCVVPYPDGGTQEGASLPLPGLLSGQQTHGQVFRCTLKSFNVVGTKFCTLTTCLWTLEFVYLKLYAILLKYFIGILNSLIALPMRYKVLNVQRILMISQFLDHFQLFEHCHN